MPVSELLYEPLVINCHLNRGVKDTRPEKLYLVCVAAGRFLLCVCVCVFSLLLICRVGTAMDPLLQSHIEMTSIKQII